MLSDKAGDPAPCSNFRSSPLTGLCVAAHYGPFLMFCLAWPNAICLALEPKLSVLTVSEKLLTSGLTFTNKQAWNKNNESYGTEKSLKGNSTRRLIDSGNHSYTVESPGRNPCVKFWENYGGYWHILPVSYLYNALISVFWKMQSLITATVLAHKISVLLV